MPRSLGQSLLIVIAFLLGLLVGWLLRGRFPQVRRGVASSPAESAPSPVARAAAVHEPVAEPVSAAEPVADPGPVATAGTEPAVDTELVAASEPVVGPETGTAGTPEPAPVAEMDPVAQADPVADPATAAQPKPEQGIVPVAFVEPSSGPVDNLTRIEGIGPRIAAALAAAGIRTFGDLADSDVGTLRATLKAAGLRVVPNLATWPVQARPLVETDEGSLSTLTGPLVADREPVAKIAAPAAVPGLIVDATPDAIVDAVRTPDATVVPQPGPGSQVRPEPEPELEPQPEPVRAPAEMPQQRVAEPDAPAAADDLKRIEGIGPKMAGALNAAGITTYEGLAASDEVTIRAAISAAGLRFAPSLVTWPHQARLLADSDETGFADLTRRLVGGRDTRLS